MASHFIHGLLVGLQLAGNSRRKEMSALAPAVSGIIVVVFHATKHRTTLSSLCALWGIGGWEYNASQAETVRWSHDYLGKRSCCIFILGKGVSQECVWVLHLSLCLVLCLLLFFKPFLNKIIIVFKVTFKS